MNPREVVNFIAAEPFRPFRIQMASGRSFEVRHPEMAQVGRTTLTAFSALDDDGGSQEQWHRISLLLIECIEPIQASVG
ncbi:MAG TPA: hypothetical protein VMF30_19165 [Pirellulales bacterium]|nr:hypothetical protein [Pirellulales bacterium]